MLKSMTGFGRFELSLPQGKFVLELQSVNRKGFELNVVGFATLPFSFEVELRKKIQKQIERGRITARLIFQESFSKLQLPSVELLQKLHKEWEERAQALGITSPIDLAFLSNWAVKFSSLDQSGCPLQEEELSLLDPLFDTAIERLMEMKKREGAFLKTEIETYLFSLENEAKRVLKESKKEQERFEKELVIKFSELFTPNEADRERLIKEAFYMLEKSDISEEGVRISSHIEQFRLCLIHPKESVGRKLDFLAQEMMREVSTMGAKSLGVEMAKLVIEMKTQIDKVREQIQNIE